MCACVCGFSLCLYVCVQIPGFLQALLTNDDAEKAKEYEALRKPTSLQSLLQEERQKSQAARDKILGKTQIDMQSVIGRKIKPGTHKRGLLNHNINNDETESEKQDTGANNAANADMNNKPTNPTSGDATTSRHARLRTAASTSEPSPLSVSLSQQHSAVDTAASPKATPSTTSAVYVSVMSENEPTAVSRMIGSVWLPPHSTRHLPELAAAEYDKQHIHGKNIRPRKPKQQLDPKVIAALHILYPTHADTFSAAEKQELKTPLEPYMSMIDSDIDVPTYDGPLLPSLALPSPLPPPRHHTSISTSASHTSRARSHTAHVPTPVRPSTTSSILPFAQQFHSFSELSRRPMTTHSEHAFVNVRLSNHDAHHHRKPMYTKFIGGDLPVQLQSAHSDVHKEMSRPLTSPFMSDAQFDYAQRIATHSIDISVKAKEAARKAELIQHKKLQKQQQTEEHSEYDPSLSSTYNILHDTQRLSSSWSRTAPLSSLSNASSPGPHTRSVSTTGLNVSLSSFTFTDTRPFTSPIFTTIDTDSMTDAYNAPSAEIYPTITDFALSRRSSLPTPSSSQTPSVFVRLNSAGVPPPSRPGPLPRSLTVNSPRISAHHHTDTLHPASSPLSSISPLTPPSTAPHLHPHPPAPSVDVHMSNPFPSSSVGDISRKSPSSFAVIAQQLESEHFDNAASNALSYSVDAIQRMMPTTKETRELADLYLLYQQHLLHSSTYFDKHEQKDKSQGVAGAVAAVHNQQGQIVSGLDHVRTKESNIGMLQNADEKTQREAIRVLAHVMGKFNISVFSYNSTSCTCIYITDCLMYFLCT